MSEPPLILYTTPPIDRLPASDLESVYLASLLQLTCGPSWGLRSGDWTHGDNQLPYITHLGHRLRPRHLNSLSTFSDPDANLTSTEQAESLSWRAYIEGQLSDLINYVSYSLPPNYPNLVAPAQLSGLPFPMSQYLPQRLRSTHRSRLEHVGLWGLGGVNLSDAEAEDRKRLDETFVTAPGGTQAPRAWTGWRAGRVMEDSRRRLGQEEVLRRARAIFDPLQRRLGEHRHLVGSTCTTVDLFLFSHLTFLLSVDWPNPLLTTLLRETYSDLVDYHDRILRQLYGPTGWSVIARLPAQTTEVTSLWDRISSTWSQRSNPSKSSKVPSAMERKLRKQRWMWYAFSAGAMLTYIFASGLVKIEMVKEAADEDEEESQQQGGDEEDEEDDDEEEKVEEVVVKVEEEEQEGE